MSLHFYCLSGKCLCVDSRSEYHKFMVCSSPGKASADAWLYVRLAPEWGQVYDSYEII